MEIVIDAQVVRGYFMETVLEIDSSLTQKAQLVFDRIGFEDQTFLDDRGIIEHEWRNLVDPEWFDAWYARLLQTGAASQIPVTTCHELRRRLESNGFPRGSRDIWYIRTAKALVDRFHRAFILTEDLHFFDPRRKGADARERQRILLSCTGPVAQYLQRRERIAVRCVAAYLESVNCV